MKFPHIVGAAILIAVGYFLGAKWPVLAQRVGIA